MYAIRTMNRKQILVELVDSVFSTMLSVVLFFSPFAAISFVCSRFDSTINISVASIVSGIAISASLTIYFGEELSKLVRNRINKS